MQTEIAYLYRNLFCKICSLKNKLVNIFVRELHRQNFFSYKFRMLKLLIKIESFSTI